MRLFWNYANGIDMTDIEFNIKYNAVPVSIIDALVIVEWRGVVESHRTKGNDIKVGEYKVGENETIHFEVVEERAEFKFSNNRILNNKFTKLKIMLDLNQIKEKAIPDIPEKFSVVQENETFKDVITEFNKNKDNYLKSGIIDDLSNKYSGKNYKPDTITILSNTFSENEKHSFFAVFYLPVYTFSFKDVNIQYLPVNKENKVQYDNSKLNRETQPSLKMALAIRNAVFMLIGIWVVYGIYRFFNGGVLFSEWMFTIWWWFKIIFFTALFVMTLVGYFNYVEDENQAREKLLLEKSLAKFKDAIDKKIIEKRNKVLSKKVRQFSIFNYIDSYLQKQR